MNDDTLLTAVRDTFAGVRMDTPPEQIVRRGRAVRARRRLPRVAGAVAAVAGTAVAVTALLPASHQPETHLAAWTVTRQADGAILVTIRQLTDPADLQRTLRADGVRASVTFDDQQNPACRNYSKPSSALTNSVIGMPLGYHEPTLVIHPSKLPADAGLQIEAGRLEHPSQGGIAIGFGFGLVQASQACTGS
jgi:hypothetical protein